MKEIHRKLLQYDIGKGKISRTKNYASSLRMLIEEYTFWFIWPVRLALTFLFILLLVYSGAGVNMTIGIFGVAILLL